MRPGPSPASPPSPARDSVGKATIGKLAVRRLEIEELEVGRLTVHEGWPGQGPGNSAGGRAGV